MYAWCPHPNPPCRPQDTSWPWRKASINRRYSYSCNRTLRFRAHMCVSSHAQTRTPTHTHTHTLYEYIHLSFCMLCIYVRNYYVCDRCMLVHGRARVHTHASTHAPTQTHAHRIHVRCVRLSVSGCRPACQSVCAYVLIHAPM